MQKIGFNVQKNAAPAFGCGNCKQTKKLLTGKGVMEEVADSFIQENTKKTWLSSASHEEKAANLLSNVQKKINFYVEGLKDPLNYGG
jgi:hypothetical protein